MAPPLLWLLAERGLTGTENQLLAVSERLKTLVPGLEVERKEIERGSWFFPRTDPSWYWQNETAKPDLVLAAGRQALFPALSMKKRGAKVVFIQDPRAFRNKFDAIYAPRHDPAKGGNVFSTDGTITRQERCVRPGDPDTVFFIVGGSRKGAPIELDACLLPLLAQRSNLLVTFSRRTPEHVKSHIKSSLSNATFFDPVSDGFNPYREWLCRASLILVTDDSTAMASDACSTGRGVYIIPFIRPKGRLARFADHLVAIKAARRFEGALDRLVPETVLNDAEKVASDIAARFLPR